MLPKTLSYPVIATYALLYATVVLLWLPKIRGLAAWWVTAFLCLIFAFIAHQMHLIGAAFLLTLTVLIIGFKQSKQHTMRRIILGTLILLLSIGLATHKLPGFHNLIVMNKALISPGAIPYTLYLNVDKTFMGILILGLSHPLIANWKQAILAIKNTLPIAILTIFAVMLLALALGLVRFDPKIPHAFFIWSATNLLFTCLAEEALFRGFIQKNLMLIFHRFKHTGLLSILISSLLFGLAHYAGGWKYTLLATIAGIGYGTVYYRTKRIEASILSHFLLNTTHFLLFTYPILANAVP